MGETKPFASLSSSLLARKGMAKPAMRPQGFGHFGGIEDLGWNDMGQGRAAPEVAPEALPERRPSSISALTPGPVTENAAPVAAEAPPVVEQQRDLATRFASEAPKLKASARKTAAQPNVGAKTKSAFTLRLDPERHLRLRLACAMSRRSAQNLVTEALDTFLDGMSIDAAKPD